MLSCSFLFLTHLWRYRPYKLNHRLKGLQADRQHFHYFNFNHFKLREQNHMFKGFWTSLIETLIIKQSAVASIIVGDSISENTSFLHRQQSRQGKVLNFCMLLLLFILQVVNFCSRGVAYKHSWRLKYEDFVQYIDHRFPHCHESVC